MIAEQRAGFGGSAAGFFVLDADRFEESIDGGRGDAQEGGRDVGGQGAEELDIARQPEWDNRFEAFRAGQVGSLPDFFEGFEDRFLCVGGGAARFFVFGFLEAFKGSEEANGVFAVVVESGAEFVKDLFFFLAGSIFVADEDTFFVFPF